jgi:hypothetical protein
VSENLILSAGEEINKELQTTILTALHNTKVGEGVSEASLKLTADRMSSNILRNAFHDEHAPTKLTNEVSQEIYREISKPSKKQDMEALANSLTKMIQKHIQNSAIVSL